MQNKMKKKELDFFIESEYKKGTKLFELKTKREKLMKQLQEMEEKLSSDMEEVAVAGHEDKGDAYYMKGLPNSKFEKKGTHMLETDSEEEEMETLGGEENAEDMGEIETLLRNLGQKLDKLIDAEESEEHSEEEFELDSEENSDEIELADDTEDEIELADDAEEMSDDAESTEEEMSDDAEESGEGEETLSEGTDLMLALADFLNMAPSELNAYAVGIAPTALVAMLAKGSLKSYIEKKRAEKQGRQKPIESTNQTAVAEQEKEVMAEGKKAPSLTKEDLDSNSLLNEEIQRMRRLAGNLK